MESACGSPVRRPVIYFVASIIFFSSEVFGCQDDPVGIADPNIIPDRRFTATSSWHNNANEPWDARLNGADYGWAPRTPSDPNDYLQIDLGQVYVLCAIATQGCNGCSERTTQYKISTSVDKNTGVWATYKNGVIDKLFTGNTDSNTVVKNVLNYPVLVRYIRFIPTTYNVWKTMRVEAYGYIKVPYGAPVSALAYSLSSQSVRVTWNASKCGSYGPIRGYKIMCAAISRNVTKEYLTSANQTSYNITSLEKWTEYRITVKCFNDNGEGPASAEVTVRTMEDAPGKPNNFEVTVLSSTCMQLDWALPSEANGVIRGFKIRYKNLTKSNGFSSSTTLSGNGTLSYVLTGLDSCTSYSFKILAYTIKDGPYTHEIQRTTAENVCQSNAVGIADRNIITDNRFTASSQYDIRYAPMNARLNGAARGWGPRTANNPNDYLQIDLGQVFVICAVASQGANGINEWTTEYKISTSIDKNTSVWDTYKNGIADKLFPGNIDTSTVVKNVLNVPVLARYIRFIPIVYYSWKTLRVEAYGFIRDLQWTSPAPAVENITSTSAAVRWRKITESPLQANITFYIVKCHSINNIRISNVSGSEASVVDVTGLTPDTNYSVKIKAVSRNDHGQWSCPTSFITPASDLPPGKQTQKETNEARREKKETTCISSSIVATSLAFNVAFLVFILLLVVYINHLKKQLEEANKAEKRQTNAFDEVLYSNTNAITSEGSVLPMQQLPSHDNSTYESITSCGIVTGAN